MNQKKDVYLFDLICLIDEEISTEEVTLKSGGTTMLKKVSVFDEDHFIQINFWNDLGNYKFKKHQVVLFKNVYLKDYKGLTLNTTKETEIIDNIPNIPRYK